MNISPRARRYCIVLIGVTAIATIVYYLTDGSPSETRSDRASNSQVNRTDRALPTHPDSVALQVELDCVIQTSVGSNPFGGFHDACKPGIPSKEVEALAGDRDPKELTKGYTYDLALAVLNVEPGSAVEAYLDYGKCLETAAEGQQTPERQDECMQIYKVLPYTMLTLGFESNEGNTKASLLMADYYAWILTSGAEASTWQFYLERFDKYAGRAGQSHAQQINELRESVMKYRA